MNLESRMSNLPTIIIKWWFIDYYRCRKWTLFYSITIKIHFTFIIYIILIYKKLKNSTIYKWFITYIHITIECSIIQTSRSFDYYTISTILIFSLIYLNSLIKLIRLLSRFLIPGNEQCQITSVLGVMTHLRSTYIFYGFYASRVFQPFLASNII